MYPSGAVGAVETMAVAVSMERRREGSKKGSKEGHVKKRRTRAHFQGQKQK